MDEATGELGTGFSVDVVRKWEGELFAAPTPHIRRVALRTALVLGHGGGVYEAFARLVRLGLGGTLGPGSQMVSWVHVEDLARSIEWLIEHQELEGPVDCAAPHPLPNREFMRTFREVLHRPLGLPAAAWMLEIGAFLMRTETELLLKSRWALPTRLLQSGFSSATRTSAPPSNPSPPEHSCPRNTRKGAKGRRDLNAKDAKSAEDHREGKEEGRRWA